MRRCCCCALLAALVVCVTTPPAGASAAQPKTRSKCARLKGKDIAPARYVKLVARANEDDGSDLLGCMLPRGPVRTIASSADFYTTQASYAVLQVAGRIVLGRSTSSSQYAYSERTWVYDVRTGRGYAIASQCAMIGGDDCAAGGSSVAPAAFVTGAGRGVALVFGRGPGPSPDPGQATIARFGTTGVRRDLDTGPAADLPPESLALSGNIASWLHAGEPRSADLRTRD